MSIKGITSAGSGRDQILRRKGRSLRRHGHASSSSCSDRTLGPCYSPLLVRNNLVEPYWKEIRKGFLDFLLKWDWCCAYGGEDEFYRQIVNDEISRAGLTRALQLLGLGQDTIAKGIDRSFAEKRFAPLCDLLKDANPSLWVHLNPEDEIDSVIVDNGLFFTPYNGE